MLILFFSIYLRWMPPVVWVDFFTDPRRNLTIMLLPALCLGTASAANIARTTRSCMLDVLRSEYIRTAAAKGLADRARRPEARAQERADPHRDGGRAPGGHPARRHRGGRGGVHAARASAGSCCGRSTSATTRSRSRTILFIAVMFMAINLAVDVLYGYLDPRIRYSA